MTQAYLPQFVELFQNLTGLNIDDVQIGEDGWLFVPPEVNLKTKDRPKREVVGLLGSRNHVINDEYAGWWINPWKNLEGGTYIALTLSEYGADGFTYLRNGKPGQRHVYYISYINAGTISGKPMLLGQFLFEFEGAPSDALRLTPGFTNRIYYPQDRRISSYDPLTEAEIEETRNRLMKLSEKYPVETAKLIEKVMG